MREKTAVFVIGNKEDVDYIRSVLIPEPERVERWVYMCICLYIYVELVEIGMNWGLD